MDLSSVLTIITSFTSVIAVVISLLTLRQNSIMIENSTRPCIGVYGLSVYVRSPSYYIVIKNFGQSSARIDSFSCDIDLSKITRHNEFVPFSNIEGTTMMPGQTYRAAIDFSKVKTEKIRLLTFLVSYSSGRHTYRDSISLKIDANLGNLEAHPSFEETTPESVLAETLLDIHIKSL